MHGRPAYTSQERTELESEGSLWWLRSYTQHPFSRSAHILAQAFMPLWGCSDVGVRCGDALLAVVNDNRRHIVRVMCQPYVVTTSDTKGCERKTAKGREGAQCPPGRPRGRLAALSEVGGRQRADSPALSLHPARSPAPGERRTQGWTIALELEFYVLCKVQPTLRAGLESDRPGFCPSSLSVLYLPSAELGQSDWPSRGLTGPTSAMETCTCVVLHDL